MAGDLNVNNMRVIADRSDHDNFVENDVKKTINEDSLRVYQHSTICLLFHDFLLFSYVTTGRIRLNKSIIPILEKYFMNRYFKFGLAAIWVVGDPTNINFDAIAAAKAEALIKLSNKNFMKKLLIGLLALGSMSAFAETNTNIIKLQNPLQPETQLPFSAQSVQRLDGVCKSLSYANYVYDSARRSNQLTDTVLVNGDGQVISMPKFEPLVEIWCEGKGQSPALQGIVRIKNPVHSESKLPFSIRNAQRFDGVCKYLGYSDYIGSSARRTGHNEDTVVLDGDGKPTIVRDWFESLEELSCIP